MGLLDSLELRKEQLVYLRFAVEQRYKLYKDTEEINKNKNDLTIIKTWGAMALIVVPLIVSDNNGVEYNGISK